MKITKSRLKEIIKEEIEAIAARLHALRGAPLEGVEETLEEYHLIGGQGELEDADENGANDNDDGVNDDGDPSTKILQQMEKGEQA